MDIVKVVLTSLLSVVAMFFIAKLMGHKQVSQLDFFDYVSGITVGSVAAELATEFEAPWKPLIAMLVYGAISVMLSCISNKFPRSRKYLNGTPTVIMDNGVIYRENLKKAKLDISELMLMCREAGYFDLNDIQTAVFECNGRLSILPVSARRPLTADDVKLKVEQELIGTEVIADGRVLSGNLKRRGLDGVWLKRQLEKQGIKDEKDVFLGVCDNNNVLTVFKAK